MHSQDAAALERFQGNRYYQIDRLSVCPERFLGILPEPNEPEGSSTRETDERKKQKCGTGYGGAVEEAGQKGQRAINVTHVRNVYAFVEKLSRGNGDLSYRGQVRFSTILGLHSTRRLLAAKRPATPGQVNQTRLLLFEKSSQIHDSGVYRVGQKSMRERQRQCKCKNTILLHPRLL